MKKINILKKYDLTVDELAKSFVKKYFDYDDTYILGDDYYWVGSQDEDREILAVGEYFFTIDRLIDSLRYFAPKKKLFDYYELELEFATKNKKMEINFRNYIKLK